MQSLVRRHRMVVSVAAACAATAVLAACSSSGSGSTSSVATGSSSGTSSSSGASQFAAVEAALAKYSAQPVVDLPALPAAPQKGLKVVYLANSAAPQDVLDGKEFTAAAQVLGWSPSTVNYAGDPASLSSAIEQVIPSKPAAIVVSGQDPSWFANALKDASAAGVPIFDGGPAAHATGMTANGLSGVSIGINFLAAEGQLAADWIIKDSNGGADTAIVTLPEEKSLGVSVTAFQDELKKYCPSCKSVSVNAQITDIGQALPGKVVSALQSNPSIKYVYYAYGDLSIGVPAAMRAAGLSPKVVSTVGSTQTYADLKSGAEVATMVTSAQVQGFLEADLIARYYADGKKPVEDPTIPIQIFDSSNDSSASLPVTPADYQAQFTKIWGIG